jgi:hypothetical protein
VYDTAKYLLIGAGSLSLLSASPFSSSARLIVSPPEQEHDNNKCEHSHGYHDW